MKLPVQKRIFWDTLLIVIINICFIFSLDYKGTNGLCLATYFINGLVILTFMVNALRKSSFSIELVYWLFMYFFMFFSPLIQYTYGEFPWHHERFSNGILLAVNLSVLVWNLIFALIMNMKRKCKKDENVVEMSAAEQAEVQDVLIEKATDEKVNFQVSELLCKGLAIFGIILAAGYLIMNGVGVLGASRDTRADLFPASSSAIGTLVNKCLEAALTFSATISFYYAKQTKEKKYFILSLIAVAICLFPTSLARYMMVVVYGSILVTCFKPLKKGSLFFWGLILAFLIAFPALNVFRYAELGAVNIFETIANIFKNFYEGYLEGHYDAYSMLCSIIKYIDLHGITFGKQLLGCILFFVPRAIWPTKPIGSGAMVAEELGYSFANLSCPLIAEFVINFGYIGVVIGSVLFAVIARKSDDLYTSSKRGMFLECFYPVGVMFLFFILRGDLMSSFSYFVAFFAVYYAGTKVNQYIIKRKEGNGKDERDEGINIINYWRNRILR